MQKDKQKDKRHTNKHGQLHKKANKKNKQSLNATKPNKHAMGQPAGTQIKPVLRKAVVAAS